MKFKTQAEAEAMLRRMIAGGVGHTVLADAVRLEISRFKDGLAPTSSKFKGAS